MNVVHHLERGLVWKNTIQKIPKNNYSEHDGKNKSNESSIKISLLHRNCGKNESATPPRKRLIW